MDYRCTPEEKGASTKRKVQSRTILVVGGMGTLECMESMVMELKNFDVSNYRDGTNKNDPN